MQQPYVSTLIEQDFTSAEKALGRHNIDAISSADLEGYATQEWVQDQNYITSADLPDVSDMATKTWTSENFYPDTNPSGFITSSDVPRYREGDYISIDPISLAISVTGINPDDYVTQEELDSATSGKMDSTEASAFYPRYDNPEGYITSADLPDLSDYATKDYVDSATSGKQDSLEFGYTDNRISYINSSAIYCSGGNDGSEVYRKPYGGSETFVSALKINSDDPDGYAYVTADDVGQGYLVQGPYKTLLDAGINSGYGVGDSATPIYIDNNGTFQPVSGVSFTQVQSDWTESNSSSASYIKNKPTPLPIEAGYGIELTNVTSAIKVSSSLMTLNVEAYAMDYSTAGYVHNIYPHSSACLELHVTTPHRYDAVAEYSAKIDDDATWAIPSGAWYDFIKQDFDGTVQWCFKDSGQYYA